MAKFLLSIITVSGLCAVPSECRDYHFVYDFKNWTDAQSYCREKHTDLATVDNMEDVTILNNMADKSKMDYPGYKHRAWIGLYDDVNSWRWSLSDKRFYKHGETQFRQWSPGEPNNANSAQHCTLMLDNGEWRDHACETQLKAVCSDVKGQNVTFVLTDTNMSWTGAQSSCREHYTDLASVRNLTENQKVRELVPAGEYVWIGLFRDTWKWSDGSNSPFSYWKTWEPGNVAGKEACVAASFDHSALWEDWNCDLERPFICYSARLVHKQVIKVRFERKNSSLDLNDPAVMEAILKQYKQKLKDQGLSDNIRLSWKKQSDGKVFHKEEKKKKKTNDEL